MVGFVFLIPPWERSWGLGAILPLPLRLSMAAQGHVKLFLFTAAFLTRAALPVPCVSVRGLRASSRTRWFFVLFVLVGVWSLILIVVWWCRSSDI